MGPAANKNSSQPPWWATTARKSVATAPSVRGDPGRWPVGIVEGDPEDPYMSMRQQVEETIEVIRPALQADGGDIVLRDVDESTGVVSVELVGACTTCPASDQTMKAGIERIMKDRIDGVTEVVQVA